MEITSTEFNQLKQASDGIRDDLACLDAWCDSLEYEVKNYVGDKPFHIFAGFIQSLELHQKRLNQILKSQSLF